MSLPWIVIGDRTSHGGTVIEGHPTTDIDGRLVATVGHQVSCPKCKGTFPIATGAADLVIDGKSVARHGDQTACGASLISSQVRTYWSTGQAMLKALKTNDASGILKTATDEVKGYDQHFLVKDENTGEPAVDRYYRIHYNGRIAHGRTDANGYTQKVADISAEEVMIEVFPEGT